MMENLFSHLYKNVVCSSGNTVKHLRVRSCRHGCCMCYGTLISRNESLISCKSRRFLSVQSFISIFYFFTYICIFPYNQIVITNERSQVRLKTSNKLIRYLLKNYFVFIQASEGIENEQRSTEIAECLEKSDWD